MFAEWSLSQCYQFSASYCASSPRELGYGTSCCIICTTRCCTPSLRVLYGGSWSLQFLDLSINREGFKLLALCEYVIWRTQRVNWVLRGHQDDDSRTQSLIRWFTGFQNSHGIRSNLSLHCCSMKLCKSLRALRRPSSRATPTVQTLANVILIPISAWTLCSSSRPVLPTFSMTKH